MVTGLFNFEAYGFLRDFSLERSYSVFMPDTLIERAFTFGYCYYLTIRVLEIRHAPLGVALSVAGSVVYSDHRTAALASASDFVSMIAYFKVITEPDHLMLAFPLPG